MILQIVCSENELKKVKELFPNAQVIVQVENTKLFSSKKETHNTKVARMEMIKNILRTKDQPIAAGDLYRDVREEGYPVSYKSFQRDMILLHSIGDCLKEVKRGGVVGSTTMWRLAQNDN